MEIANNNLIDDYPKFESNLKFNFSEDILEIKYFIRDEKELKHFFEKMEFYQNKIKQIKQEYKFKKVFCRFYFGKLKVSYDNLKKLIDFQSNVFDEITIQKIGRDFNNFERSYEYAVENYDKPISLVLDIKDHSLDFKQSLDYLKTWNLSNIRFIYGKIDTHFSKYFLISKIDKKLDFYLVACPKRCKIRSIEDPKCSNIPVSILSKSKLFFNFDACCMDYLPRSKTHKGQKFVPPEKLSFFNPKTLLWEEKDNDGSFRKQRLLDFNNLNNIKVTDSMLNNNPTIKKVIDYFGRLNP
jgi:hypothetical protein